MRKSTSLLVLSLMVGAVGCELSTGDEGDDGVTGKGRNGGDGGERGAAVPPTGATNGGGDAGKPSPAPQDAAVNAAPNDAGSPPSDAGTSVQPPGSTTTFVALAQCEGVVPEASAVCGAVEDPFETNDQKAQSTLVEPKEGCSVFQSKLTTGKDDDWYYFIPERTEPVRISMAYDQPPTSAAEPKFELYDATNTRLAYTDGNPLDGPWKYRYAIVVKKGVAHYVLVSDASSSNSCIPYTLRIEPSFCTDAYEDNDTKATAAKGITYGTTLEGSVFYGDSDFYDLSAIQAAGARCTITIPD
ncbi:MAG TPA: hypothetical protein VFX59_29365, partial [Polyangiales bacterium]|nr:hypothetical protein [Polyangiales bacterium]